MDLTDLLVFTVLLAVFFGAALEAPAAAVRLTACIRPVLFFTPDRVVAVAGRRAVVPAPALRTGILAKGAARRVAAAAVRVVFAAFTVLAVLAVFTVFKALAVLAGVFRAEAAVADFRVLFAGAARD